VVVGLGGVDGGLDGWARLEIRPQVGARLEIRPQVWARQEVRPLVRARLEIRSWVRLDISGRQGLRGHQRGGGRLKMKKPLW
jgi:hypothetical protein